MKFVYSLTLSLSLVPALASAADCGIGESRVTIVTPAFSGSSADSVAQTLADGMTRAARNRDARLCFQTEARSGGGGSVAGIHVKRAAAADSVLLLGDSKNPSFNLYQERPLQLLGSATDSPMVIVASERSGIESVRDLEKMQRHLSFANAGPGTDSQACAEALGQMTAPEAPHVPFLSDVHVLGTLKAGAADVACLPISALKLDPSWSSGARVIATVAPQRLAQFPQTPTLEEVGLRGVPRPTNHLGLFARPDVSSEAAARFKSLLSAGLSDPETRIRLSAIGVQGRNEAAPGTPPSSVAAPAAAQ